MFYMIYNSNPCQTKYRYLISTSHSVIFAVLTLMITILLLLVNLDQSYFMPISDTTAPSIKCLIRN